MNWRNHTPNFIWLILIAVVVWDIAAKTFGGMGATVSSLLFNLGYDWPVIPFMAGLLCGHFFFSMWGRESKKMVDAIARGVSDAELAALARENFGGA